MPRRVRIRQTSDAESNASREVRRHWLTIWKRWAVRQLPLTLARDVRVELRLQVERALLRFGPDDDEEEVRDIVLRIVEDALRRVQAENDRRTQEENKRAVVAEAESLLRLVLAKFPRDEVAAMLKQRGYSLTALTQGLKRHLERHVTGIETIEGVLGRIVAWVERRLAEQPKPSRHWPGTAVKIGGATAVLAAMALKNPQMRETVGRGIEIGRDKARELWTRWKTRSDPPTQP